MLVLSGFFESGWAIALDRSDGFSHIVPTIVFAICLVLSMAGLGYASKTLPMGVAYAVWTGIGVIATVTFGMATGIEPLSWAKVLLLLGLVGCIAGLRIVSE